jgi:hypothetical protein
MRQSTAGNIVFLFPDERQAIGPAAPKDESLDTRAQMSLRFCFTVWLALAVIGWGALDAITTFI